MRKFVLCALLVTMPFGGMRVMCVDAPAPADTDSDCERLCARHHVSSSTDGSTCMLTADACALLAFATTVGVGPDQPPADLGLDVSAAPAGESRVSPDPDLAHHVPPPKTRILR